MCKCSNLIANLQTFWAKSNRKLYFFTFLAPILKHQSQNLLRYPRIGFDIGKGTQESNHIAIALDGVRILFFLEKQERISQKKLHLGVQKKNLFCRILQTLDYIF